MSEQRGAYAVGSLPGVDKLLQGGEEKNMIVKFIEVGRDKKSWEAKTSELTYEWLYGQVKQNKALSSSDLTFYENGTIWAGFRMVGKFEVVRGEEKA